MKYQPAYERLMRIETNIASPDHKRVGILRTSSSQVQKVLEAHWPTLKQQLAVSEMIARRMFYHFKTQKDLKTALGISLAPVGAGVLEQAVGMYLAAYLRQFPGLEVTMNTLFGRRIRPDIAVLYNGDRLATVEVKIDLGWQRSYFRPEKKGVASRWDARVRGCRQAGFKRSYILVLTKSNWLRSYSEIEARAEAEGIFVLLKEHPNDEKRFRWYRDDSERLRRSDVIRPIEGMLEEIGALAQHCVPPRSAQ